VLAIARRLALSSQARRSQQHYVGEDASAVSKHTPELQAALRAPQPEAPLLVVAAMGAAVSDQHRAACDTHDRALRALANRLLGILHGCLAHGTLYDELTASGHRQQLVP
jgi:hypothetical protein